MVTPAGTTVVPMTETQTTYTAPLLNIPAYKKGDDTKIKVDFTGALTGARANVFITPRKDGPTEVKMRFHDLKEAPAGQKFILWAVSPDGKFTKLGQVVNAPGRNEAEIKSETTLPDFGLVVTMESADRRHAGRTGRWHIFTLFRSLSRNMRLTFEGRSQGRPFVVSNLSQKTTTLRTILR